jgi:two-component system, cell cycle response regulator DivK
MPQRKRLLIVDDDKNAREGYRAYLSQAGFHVEAAGGGVEALAFVQSATPDLLVLDLSLPDVDGWEVARRLRSEDHTRDIPIIAFSGRTLQHEQISALRAGCDVYLTKPCEPTKLLEAVRKLLRMPEPAANKRAVSDPY